MKGFRERQPDPNLFLAGVKMTGKEIDYYILRIFNAEETREYLDI